MRRNLLKKGKTKAAFMVMLFLTAFMISLLPEVAVAEVAISIEPEVGHVGDTLRVNGTIETPNGNYTIFFGEELMKNGTAVETTVNDTFVVPHRPMDNYTVMLHDVEANKNVTATFSLETNWYIEAVVPPPPKQLQEGMPTKIWVNVTGGEANTVYFANITVKDPENKIYWATTWLTNTTTTGSGNGGRTYPTNFTAGAHTNYTGIYNIAFNETLAIGNFTVGLTDEPEYRQTNRVNIQGAGFGEKENVTINIAYATTGESVFSVNRSAIDGIVAYFWTIPENATLGIYTVTLANVTTPGTVKPVPDIQNFTVIEIIVHCLTQNRYDNKSLAGLVVEAYVGTTPIVSGTTNKTGEVDFRIDRGNYTFRALWKNETVGSLSESVTGDPIDYVLQENFTIGCELAHITIAINDEADPPNPLPFINVTLTSNKTGALQFETNYTAIIATYAFTNVSYTIEARRYGHLFNRTFIENLTVTLDGEDRINIICPTYTMFVHVLDSKRLPLQNVQVALYEWSSGVLADSEATNDLGSVTISSTFGRYKVRVHDWESGVVLNETVIDLIEDKSFYVIHCRISNVDLSVLVKDYFGNPIPNALVKVERENVDIPPKKTGSNGKTSFENITGGEVRVSVSVKGKLSETRTIYLDETRAVVFRLDRYVMVAGYPLETTQFIACISLGMLVALFALALIYRRFRTRKVSEEKEKSL